MGQSDKLPDTENFTREVEDVIDDLFAPSKTIEIDPLTNEIKEVDRAPERSPDELSLEPDTAVEKGEDVHPSENEAPAVEEETASSTSGPVEFDLDLELELEPEPESGPESSVQQASGSEAAEKDSDGLLNQIQQAIWTLEWEVTEESVRNLKDMLKGLDGSATSSDPGFGQVVSEMIQVLSDMERDAENVPTSAPVALKKGVEYLMASAAGESGPDKLRELFDHAVSELSAAFASQEEICESPASGPDTGEQMETLDLEIEMEPESEPEPETKPEHESAGPKVSGKAQAETMAPVPAGSGTLSQAQQRSSAGLSVETPGEPEQIPVREEKESSKILNEHLNTLRDCVRRIRPVEDLLARTRGMAKLQVFLGDLRTRLERQIELLEHGPARGVPVAQVPSGGNETVEVVPGEAQEVKRAETNRPGSESRGQEEGKCPWRELFLARRGRITVGLIMEEVAFHGTVPFWAGSGLLNQEKVILKQLKPWPWSKLSSMVQGSLLAVKEEDLAQMEVPVLNLNDPASKAERGRNVVILSQGEKTAAIFLDSEPDYFSLKAEHTYKAADAEGFLEGVLKVDGNTIHIISVAGMK